MLKIKAVSGIDMHALQEKVEAEIRRIEGTRRGTVVDVDFLIDNEKMIPYRAFIKYREASKR